MLQPPVVSPSSPVGFRGTRDYGFVHDLTRRGVLMGIDAVDHILAGHIVPGDSRSGSFKEMTGKAGKEIV
jgi:hypothetical protein